MKWVLRALAVLLVIILLVPAGLYFMVRSERGSQWLLTQITNRLPLQLDYASAQGNFLQGMVFVDFVLDTGALSISAASLDIAWQPQLLWSGTVHLDHVRVDTLGIRTAPTPQGSDSLEGWPKLQMPIPVAIDELRVEELIFNGVTLLNSVAFDGRLSGSDLHIDDLQLIQSNWRLGVQGELELTESYPMNLVLQAQTVLNDQTWSGDFNLRGDLRRLQLDIRMREPYSMTANLDLQPEVPESPADINLQALIFEARLRVPQFDLRPFVAQDIQLSNLDMNFRGPISMLAVSGSGEAQQIPWLGSTGFDIEAQWQPNVIHVSEVRLRSERGAVQLNFDYLLEQASISDAHISTDNLRVAEQINPIQAEAQLNLELQPNLRIEGTVERAELEAGGIPIALAGPFVFYDDELTSSGLNIIAMDNLAQINGRLFPDLQINWTLDAPNPGAVFLQIGSTVRASGSVQGGGEAYGSYTQPQVKADLSIDNLDVSGFTAEKIDLNIEPVASGLNRIQLQMPEAEYGEWAIRELVVGGSLGVNSFDLQTSLDFENVPMSAAVVGEREDFWRMELHKLDVDAPAQLGSWSLADTWIVQQSDVGWLLEEGCWRSSAASLCGSAQLASASTDAQAVTANLQLRDFPMEWFQIPLQDRVRLRGTLNADLNLQKLSEDMQFDISLQSAMGSFAVIGQEAIVDMVPYQALQILGNISQRQAQIDGRVLLGQSGTGVMEADAKIDFQQSQPELDANISLDVESLQWLEGIFPRIDNASGALVLNMTFSGPLGNPSISADGALRQGHFIVPQAGLDISDVAIEASANSENKIRVQASAASGGGTIRLDGEIQAPSLDAFSFEGNIEGSAFQFYDRPDMRLTADPNLRISFMPSQLRISGDLAIPEAQVRVRRLPAGGVRPSQDEVIVNVESEEASTGLAMVLDLDVQLGERVSFEGFGLTTALQGDMQIRQTLEEPRRVFGTIELKDALYNAYSRTLEVRQGRMTFQGELDNPALDVDAEQRYPQYTVGIHIGGTARDPSTILYSNPSMAQSDILAVLLTGRKLDTMASSEAPNLLDAATQLGIVGGASIAERIEQSFGLSEFGVRNDSENGQSVVAGTYLFPRLYVEWAQGLFEAASSVQLEYKINEQIKLKARSGASQSMDLIYEVERE